MIPHSHKRTTKLQNTRRTSYELTKQRDMVPIAVGAGIAALILHVWFFMYSDGDFFFVPDTKTETKVVKEEISRTIVRKKVEEIEEKPKPEEKPEEVRPDEPPPPPDKPVEIDPLDIPEDVMVDMEPGKTEISVPVPEPLPAEMAMSDPSSDDFDASALIDEPLAEPMDMIHDPTPINANDVIAVALDTAGNEDLTGDSTEADLSEGLDSDLLPEDTRSLADLLGETELGAGSGVARVGMDVLFEFDQSKLKNSARISLMQLACLIQKNPQTRFIIEGHTDSIGAADYNALLSLHRAAAVRDWLKSNDIPLEFVYIRACANTDPIADAKGDRDAQAINRRVEIHMRKPDEELPTACIPADFVVDTSKTVQSLYAKGERVPDKYRLTTPGRKPAAKPAARKSSKPRSRRGRSGRR